MPRIAEHQAAELSCQRIAAVPVEERRRINDCTLFQFPRRNGRRKDTGSVPCRTKSEHLPEPPDAAEQSPRVFRGDSDCVLRDFQDEAVGTRPRRFLFGDQPFLQCGFAEIDGVAAERFRRLQQAQILSRRLVPVSLEPGGGQIMFTGSVDILDFLHGEPESGCGAYGNQNG